MRVEMTEKKWLVDGKMTVKSATRGSKQHLIKIIFNQL